MVVGLATLLGASAKEEETGNSLNALLEEIRAMRTEHALELQRMNQLHLQEMNQLKDSIRTQGRQLDAMSNGVVAPPRRNMAADINVSSYAGLKIKSNKAKISLGADSDVHIVRSEDGVLEIFATDVFVHGTLHADAIVVNDTNLTDFVVAAANVLHTLKVQVLTSEATSSSSVDVMYVLADVVGQSWCVCLSVVPVRLLVGCIGCSACARAGRPTHSPWCGAVGTFLGANTNMLALVLGVHDV